MPSLLYSRNPESIPLRHRFVAPKALHHSPYVNVTLLRHATPKVPDQSRYATVTLLRYVTLRYSQNPFHSLYATVTLLRYV